MAVTTTKVETGTKVQKITVAPSTSLKVTNDDVELPNFTVDAPATGTTVVEVTVRVTTTY